MFHKYYIVIVNGVHVHRAYTTREEAEKAARARFSVTGRKWRIEEFYTTDPHADDGRPYGLMRR